jgi:hypothetical protein
MDYMLNPDGTLNKESIFLITLGLVAAWMVFG